MIKKMWINTEYLNESEVSEILSTLADKGYLLKDGNPPTYATPNNVAAITWVEGYGIGVACDPEYVPEGLEVQKGDIELWG